MSLSFLRKKQVAGLIMAKRKPDGGSEETGNAPEPKEEESHPLSSAASDLMSAISSGDQNGVARALEAAVQICQSYPEQQEPKE